MEFPPCAHGNREGEGSGIICIRYLILTFLQIFYKWIYGLVVTTLVFGSEGPWFNPCLGPTFDFFFIQNYLFFCTKKLFFELISTVKSRELDRSTIQFWNFMAKGHST